MTKRFRPAALPGLGASAPVSNVSATEWGVLKDRVDPGAPITDAQMIANIGGAAVWVKMPSLSPDMSLFGAVGDGITDDTAAVQACLNAAVLAELPVKIERPYRVTTVVAPDTSVIEMAGSGELVRTTTGSSIPVIDASGSLGTATALSVNAPLGSMSVTTATNPGVAAGDCVFLKSDRDPWGRSGNRPDRDVLKVASVSGAGPFTIALVDPLAHALNVSDGATIQKVNAKHVHLINPVIRYEGAIVGDGIHARYTEGFRVDGGEISRWRHYALILSMSYAPMVNGLQLRDTTATASGAGYGVGLLGGTRGGTVTNLRDTGDGDHRRPVTISSGASYNTITDSESLGGITGFDAHGNEGRGNRFSRCLVKSRAGTAFGAGNNTFGADFDTVFDSCEAIVTSVNTVGVFRSTTGSIGTQFINCTGVGGFNTMSISSSQDTKIQGGVYRGASNSAIQVADAVGGSLIGTDIQDSDFAIRTTGTSDGWVVMGNNLKNIVSGTPIQLAGTANVNANNLDR